MISRGEFTNIRIILILIVLLPNIIFIGSSITSFVGEVEVP